MSEKIKIYFASPLFSEMELMYNRYVVQKIRNALKDKVEVYLPQENESINDKSGYADSTMIALADTAELSNSEVVIAVLDGATVDVGVASEIGIAVATQKTIIGLYTDSRQGTFNNQSKINALDEIAESQFSYINLYTVGLVKSSGVVLNSVDELIKVLVDEVNFLIKEQE